MSAVVGAFTPAEVMRILRNLPSHRQVMVVILPEHYSSVGVDNLMGQLCLNGSSKKKVSIDIKYQDFCINLQRKKGAKTRALYVQLQKVQLSSLAGQLSEQAIRALTKLVELHDQCATLSSVCFYTLEHIDELEGVDEEIIAEVSRFFQEQYTVNLPTRRHRIPFRKGCEAFKSYSHQSMANLC